MRRRRRQIFRRWQQRSGPGNLTGSARLWNRKHPHNPRRAKEKGGRKILPPSSLSALSPGLQLQLPAFLPLMRHDPEQHWLLAVQLVPLDLHEQAGSVLQALSRQSILPLQLSSRPLPQVSLTAAQSVAQFEQFSDAWQMALPQQ